MNLPSQSTILIFIHRMGTNLLLLCSVADSCCPCLLPAVRSDSKIGLKVKHTMYHTLQTLEAFIVQTSLKNTKAKTQAHKCLIHVMCVY